MRLEAFCSQPTGRHGGGAARQRQAHSPAPELVSKAWTPSKSGKETQLRKAGDRVQLRGQALHKGATSVVTPARML